MKIGNIVLKNPVFSAPMAGVSDKAFRIIAREFDCGLTYTEMVSAKGLCYKNKKTFELIDLSQESGPVGIQIFGSDPSSMAEGAKAAEEAGAALIDINMGCPTPKIVKNGDGAALMKNVDLAVKIAEAVVNAVKIPVTVKMRKGWDETMVNAVELAKCLEQVGVAAVTIHGRTRDQFYSGKADWNIIREVKNSVNIPVIGNGDIWTPQDACKMMDFTGCDAVMIGRGSRGNPWIFKRTAVYLAYGELLPEPTYLERLEIAERHLELAVMFKGEKRALLEMRKHLAWYTKGLPKAAQIREKINRIQDINDLREFLRDIKREMN
ncbi:MAG TPA: tRNA dihydrouridine synthase DusB [Peptococcaceae bacterium]|nr:MAG: tRNA-dihydrouridine synthase [Clostridia bacterium 41_269]HBT20654.1 tRNA dihydrouridine synthase DusB [Peptococcaceae bacterium]